MLADKLTLIFGDHVPAAFDLDDDDAVDGVLQEAFPARDDDQLAGVVRQAVARQILRNDPVLVWETAQRLLTLGVERESVMTQLVLAFLPVVQSHLGDHHDDAGDLDYETLLAQLPLPSGQDVGRTIMSILSSRATITADELDEAVAAELGIPAGAGAFRSLLDRVTDRMLRDDKIALLPGDYVIVPEQLCTGIVLSTRGSPDDDLVMDTDLVGFGFLDDPMGEVPTDAVPGDLLIARHRQSEIVIERASEPLPVRDEEVAEVLRAYEAETREAGTSMSFEELLLNLLGEDPRFFAEPRAPLSEIVAAAGLQVRGAFIAGDDSVWRADAYARGLYRIMDRAADEAEREAALEILDAFQAVTEGDQDDPITNADLRLMLDAMADDNMLSLVTDQFFGTDDDPLLVDATAGFARRLSAAASRPLQRAVAAWLTALVAERRCDPVTAADELAAAVRHAPDFLPAVERLAWTRSDQGRAAEAVALWRQLDVPPEDPDFTAVVQAMEASVNPAAQGLRRNEPCWCGSGRKFKACHLRANDLPPLPDRMKWLLRKLIGYLERRGDPLADVIAETAWKLADRQAENFDEALSDPLVFDLVLHELGWFDRFLAERGHLLPTDEQLLFASWQLVSRSVLEIAEVRTGDGVTLQDLRTGDSFEVRDRLLSQSTFVGQVICARVLPDGHSHQLNGAVFTVPPGHEQLLINILDDPDPASLADRQLAYRAAATRAPLVTTEGEPLRRCEMVIEVFDPEDAREVLDRHYVIDGPGQWHQAHDADGNVIIRAMLRLEGSTLTIQTMSEPRMDRVSEELLDYLEPEYRILSDLREDLEMPDLSSSPALAGGSLPLIAPDMKAALSDWLEQQENRWCSEPVPALQGLTPYEAAADPTRREQVIRLIDSYGPDGGVTDEGAITMRPDRLRSLLGIS